MVVVVFRNLRKVKKYLGLAATTVGSLGGLVYFLDNAVYASENQAKPPSYPWAFRKVFTSLDHAALRRGWNVYRTVCSTCHSLEYLTFGDLVDVCMSVEEAKALAAEYEVDDDPDEEGNINKRPAKLFDKIPPPFANEQAARAANNGAYPVDLSLISNARPHEQDYLFSLLTGYVDPPAGVTLMDGQSFNPYFPGGAIGMGEMIQDGLLEYEDGTEASASQMTKDVVEFLTWVCNREWDTRRIYLIKLLGIFGIYMPVFWLIYKQRWATVKKQKIFLNLKKKC